jgi:hypothetical protein
MSTRKQKRHTQPTGYVVPQPGRPLWLPIISNQLYNLTIKYQAEILEGYGQGVYLEIDPEYKSYSIDDWEQFMDINERADYWEGHEFEEHLKKHGTHLDVIYYNHF